MSTETSILILGLVGLVHAFLLYRLGKKVKDLQLQIRYLNEYNVKGPRNVRTQ